MFSFYQLRPFCMKPGLVLVGVVLVGTIIYGMSQVSYETTVDNVQDVQIEEEVIEEPVDVLEEAKQILEEANQKLDIEETQLLEQRDAIDQKLEEIKEIRMSF